MRRSATARNAVLDVDEAGVTAKFRNRASEVAPSCARKRVDPEDVGSLGWDPVSGLEMGTDVWPSLISGRDAAGVPQAAAGRGSRNVSPVPAPSGPSEGDSGIHSGSSASLPAQLPSSPSLSIRLPPAGRSSRRNFGGPEDPCRTPQKYVTAIHGELHQPRRSRGYAKKDTEAAPKMRLPAMDTLERKRALCPWGRGPKARVRARVLGDLTRPL